MIKQFIIVFLMFSVACFAQEDKRGTIKISKNNCLKENTRDFYYIEMEGLYKLTLYLFKKITL